MKKQKRIRLTISLPLNMYGAIATEARLANLSLTDAFQQILRKVLRIND